MSTSPERGRTWGPPLRRALRLRCPRCGEGALFRSYGRLYERCPRCGLVYRREQGAQTGSMYLSAAVTQIFACLVILVVWVFSDWGVLLSTVLTLPLVVLFCIGFLPYSQAIWVAVEYATDVHNGEEWVRKRS